MMTCIYAEFVSIQLLLRQNGTKGSELVQHLLIVSYFLMVDINMVECMHILFIPAIDSKKGKGNMVE